MIGKRGRLFYLFLPPHTPTWKHIHP